MQKEMLIYNKEIQLLLPTKPQYVLTIKGIDHVYFARPDRPNWWIRFWAYLLLGMKWEKTNE